MICPHCGKDSEQPLTRKGGNPMVPDKQAQVERNFTYHPPKEGQAERYVQIREKAKEFALLILELTPASREQSLALTELETSVFWANASIARNE